MLDDVWGVTVPSDMPIELYWLTQKIPQECMGFFYLGFIVRLDCLWVKVPVK